MCRMIFILLFSLQISKATEHRDAAYFEAKRKAIATPWPLAPEYRDHECIKKLNKAIKGKVCNALNDYNTTAGLDRELEGSKKAIAYCKKKYPELRLVLPDELNYYDVITQFTCPRSVQEDRQPIVDYLENPSPENTSEAEIGFRGVLGRLKKLEQETKIPYGRRFLYKIMFKDRTGNDISIMSFLNQLEEKYKKKDYRNQYQKTLTMKYQAEKSYDFFLYDPEFEKSSHK